jgi:hypothetical protein
MGLTQGTLGVRLPNGVGVLRDCLTGLGLLAGAGGLGRLGLSTVHTTVRSTWYSTIAARRTLTSNTLAGSLTRGLELLELGSQFGNFGEQLVHLGVGKGGFVKNDQREAT